MPPLFNLRAKPTVQELICAIQHRFRLMAIVGGISVLDM